VGAATSVLTRADGDARFASLTHNQAWSTITATPTTLAGYGITDAASATHNHDATYSPLGHAHTFASLTSTPTTLSGYGITDAAASTHPHAAADITSGTVDVARLPVLAGDSGSGGTAGLVPAPASGDAGKFLKGDGTWATSTAAAAGSTGQVQFNFSGSLSASQYFTYTSNVFTFGHPATVVSQGTEQQKVAYTNGAGTVLGRVRVARRGTGTGDYDQTYFDASSLRAIPFTTGIGGDLQLWKDTTPSKATAFGASVPGNAATDHLYVSTWSPSSWIEAWHSENHALTTGTHLHVPIFSAGRKGLVVRAAGSQTANLQEWQNSSGTALTAINKDGGISFPSMADASAANGTLYYSSTASKLVYKDPGGTVNPLY
jgi:hypothetical protein